ncbi:uncharacterized protein FIBRA_06513 [Fibroporia radiculosa]|uniref:C2H2-type domain-containing protein n=1 Tax=Fibroporia radiculosa TaxID=599839 RepID=J4IBA9_9APHY|nr:uncharacterized protein FIBRA_06513 [Fibroporia radiculosa]CCM04341.1 predicted protein [Fibroporia radiculosa]
MPIVQDEEISKGGFLPVLDNGLFQGYRDTLRGSLRHFESYRSGQTSADHSDMSTRYVRDHRRLIDTGLPPDYNNAHAGYDSNYTLDSLRPGARCPLRASGRSGVGTLQDRALEYYKGLLQDAASVPRSGTEQTIPTGSVPYPSERDTPHFVPPNNWNSAVSARVAIGAHMNSIAFPQSAIYPSVIDSRCTMAAAGSAPSMTAGHDRMPAPQVGVAGPSVCTNIMPQNTWGTLVPGLDALAAATLEATKVLDESAFAPPRNLEHSSTPYAQWPGSPHALHPGHIVDTHEPGNDPQGPKDEPVTARKICEWAGCNAQLDDPSVSGVRRHFEECHAADDGASDEDSAKKHMVCRWRQCRTQVQRGNFIKHIRAVHLRMMEVTCERCERVFVRLDALVRHRAKFGH